MAGINTGSACRSATPSKEVAVWMKYRCYTLTVLRKSRLCSNQLATGQFPYGNSSSFTPLTIPTHLVAL